MTYERPGDTELPLRDRKKLRNMRQIQGVAMSMLEGRSYSQLTVEEIADAAEVSPSTVYRNFGTKEGIFLWDEYDEAIIEEFQRLLDADGPMEALAKAMHRVLDRRYELDRELVLRQLSIIESTPELRQSFAVGVDELRQFVNQILLEAGRSQLEASVLAGAIVGSLTGVMLTWGRSSGADPLPELLDQAMAMLSRGLAGA